MSTSPESLTTEQIQSIYERGPEAVIALVERLQINIVSLSERLSKLEARVHFDQFLLYLDPDRNQAASRYHKLQQALISFFDWNRSVDPASRADETLEILCRQIAEGKKFENLEQYSRGVARKVLLKEQQRRDKVPASFDDLQLGRDSRLSTPPQQNLAEKEREEVIKLECMGSCLQRLSNDERALITQYCQGEKHDKDKREELAKKLGLSRTALGVRVHRIRERLTKCRDECLENSLLRM